MRPAALKPKEVVVFPNVSSPPHMAENAFVLKLISDWLTKLQIPTKKDATLISTGSGPGVRYKDHTFPMKIET
jgi:hypothetical protein